MAKFFEEPHSTVEPELPRPVPPPPQRLREESSGQCLSGFLGALSRRLSVSDRSSVADRDRLAEAQVIAARVDQMKVSQPVFPIAERHDELDA